MSQTPAPSGANVAALGGFPESVRPILRLIQNKPTGDVTAVLVQYVASFVHPDFVCNMAMMDHLPIEAKDAALEMFTFCLSNGMTIEDQGAILAFIQPFIVSALRGPLPH